MIRSRHPVLNAPDFDRDTRSNGQGTSGARRCSCGTCSTGRRKKACRTRCPIIEARSWPHPRIEQNGNQWVSLPTLVRYYQNSFRNRITANCTLPFDQWIEIFSLAYSRLVLNRFFSSREQSPSELSLPLRVFLLLLGAGLFPPATLSAILCSGCQTGHGKHTPTISGSCTIAFSWDNPHRSQHTKAPAWTEISQDIER